MSEEEIAQSLREEVKQAKSNNIGSVVIAVLGAIIFVVSVMAMPLFKSNDVLYSALEGGLFGGIVLMAGGLAMVTYYDRVRKELAARLNNLKATLRLME